MHVERFGRGDRLVVGLHGLGGDHATFAPLVPFVAGPDTLLCPDLPGYGRSAAPPAWDLDAVIEDLAATVRAASPDGDVVLLGDCLGAALALPLLGRHEHLFRRAVLVDPFVYMPWYFRIFTRGEFGRRAYHTTFATSFGRFLTNQALRGKRSRETDLTSSFEAIRHETVLAYLRMMAAAPPAERFAGVRVPVDIAYGRKTFGAVRRSVEILAAQWPQVRRHELAGAGHLPIEEAPAELAALVFRGTRGDSAPAERGA